MNAGRQQRLRANGVNVAIGRQRNVTDFAGCAGFAGALSLLLVLPACSALTATLPPPEPVAVPVAWSATVVNANLRPMLLKTWWTSFDDSLLADLIDRALQNNAGVNSAQAALRQARALRDVAAAALLPTLGASISAQHNTNGNESGTDTHSKNFRAGLDAGWELDIFGANRHALAAGDATAEAGEASLADVRVSIAAEVALGYISLRSAQARLGIAEANLASQTETLQITRWRFQAGLVTSLETEQARASVEQTRAQLPLLQIAIEQSRHALAVLAGQPPAALAVLLAGRGVIPQSRDQIPLDIPAETIRQRPDVRAAELRLAAAVARVSVARAARLPDFRLSGSIGANAITLGTLTNGASMVSAVLAAISMPLFDGGAGSAQVRVQQAATEQALQAYRTAILAALSDVENALVAMQGDRERLLGLQNAADAAAIAAELARQRFGSGLVDFQTVLETQRTQLSSQDNVATATAEYSADQVRLIKALGGGWRRADTQLAAHPSTEIRTAKP
jgi:NodT family efflux transporter outer membrane factor (OMF) lipoprotein